MSREMRSYDSASVYGVGPGSQVQTIDLRRLMIAARRQRMTILLPAVLMGALGLTYALSKPATYDAAANLLLDASMNRAVRQAGGIDTVQAADMIENARVVLNSEKLAVDVLDRTGLHESETFMNPPESGFATMIDGAIDTVLRPFTWVRDQVMTLVAPAETIVPAEPAAEAIASDEAAPASPIIVDPKKRLAAMRLQGGVDIFRVGQSTAVAVKFTSHDPVIAAEAATA